MSLSNSLFFAKTSTSKCLLRSFFVIALFLVSSDSYSQDSITPPFSFTWDNGFQIKRADDLFLLNFGGQIMVDNAHFFQDSNLDKNYGLLDNNSRTEITSARLYFSGNVYQNIEFKFQIEFAGEEVDFKDVYIGITDIPAIGNFRIGHLHEPFRLSTLTSAKYITFMERGSNSHFSNGRNIGAVIFNEFFEERFSIQMGIFRNPNNSDIEDLSHDGYAITGRASILPIKNNEKTRLLHLGVAYSFRNPESKEYKVAISPGSRLAEKYLQTGIIQKVNTIGLANFEVAFIHGPFSVQSEFLAAAVNTEEQLNHFSNFYAEVSYFITGESKNYKSSYEGFGQVRPKKNFRGKEKGLGAWELAAKYSKTDLDDGMISAGQDYQMALGINWHLNPVTRFTLNYAYASIENLGSLNIVQTRLQIAF